MVNAEYLASCGAAILVRDADLAGQLLGQVNSLLGDRERNKEMAQAARSLAVPDAAERIAAELRAIAAGPDAAGAAA